MIANKNMTALEYSTFKKIRELLTTDLVPDKYKDNKIQNPMYGHCYHATLAMYNLLGGKDVGYKIKCGIDKDSIKHYWLEIDNRIIDPTIEQYYDLNREPPYNNYSRCDYRPSKSSKYLVHKLQGIINEEK